MKPVKPAVFKKVLVAIAFSLFIPISSHGAERGETESLIRGITPPRPVTEVLPTAKDTMIVDSFYEQSDIFQGNRTGHWSELTNRFGYTHDNVYSYMHVSEFERFDSKDYTANFGSYVSMKDSYAHLEAGFGWDIDYIYKFQSISEYGRKLYKTLFWQIGYNYRAYGTGDVHIVYPGLIYYFGNSFIAADYGASYKEGSDTANFGAIKGNFAITDFLQWYAGLIFGTRLYDIFELDAKDEYGYILYTGLSVILYKAVTLRAGYSYGTEKPKFIKRSLNFNISVKF